jgi:tetratricopeptide (TPR) repeat protein
MRLASERASQLDSENWEAQALRAWVQMSQHQFLTAERSMQRAIALRERDGSIGDHMHCPTTCYYQQLGRISEALAESRKIEAFDPLSPGAETWSYLYLLGRREEARDAFIRGEMLQVTPFSRRQFEQWFALENSNPAAMNAYLAGTRLEGMWGMPERLIPAVERFVDSEAEFPRGTRATLGMYAALHGDNSLALRLLRAEFLQIGFGAYYLMWHPAFAGLRATPEFVEFMTELGFVELWRETGLWGDFCGPGPDLTVVCR